MVSQQSRKVPQLLSVLALSLSLAAQAQPSFQRVDLNTTEEQETVEGVYDQSLAPLGNDFVYSVDDGVHGYELWKTDGTPGGEILLADICPGACGSVPRTLTPSGGRLFFFADDGEHGRELWVTDGTPEGTTLVKDIWPGIRSGSDQYLLFDAAGTVYFPAHDGVVGYELWKSDGTAAGTVLVKDIRPGAEGSMASAHARSSGGTILLAADDGTHGREPWVTDGTAGGTRLLKDIRPGSTSSVFGQTWYTLDHWLGASNGRFFFLAGEATSTPELWVSDGTEAGTLLLTGNGLSAGLSPHLTEAAGIVYFAGTTSGLGTELWRTDGTPAGTTLVEDIRTGVDGSWPDQLTPALGRLFFTASGTAEGIELWTSDGTAAGTFVVKDILPGTASSQPFGLDAVAGQLLFFSYGGAQGILLWKTDGTEAGTSVVYSFASLPTPTLLLVPTDSAPAGGRLYFRAWDVAHEIDLWASDGTAAGTGVVAETTSLTSSIWVSPWTGQVADPSAWGPLGGKLIYLADDGTTGPEPWTTDGTPGGTQLLAELEPGPVWTYYSDLTPLGPGSALFSYGRLLKTDGTPGGTTSVYPIDGPSASSLTRIGSTVFFFGSSLGTRALWKTDGTGAGTVSLKTFYTTSPRDLTAVGSTLFLVANGNSGSSNQELWKSDGTAAGTVLVREIRPGLEPSSPDRLTAAGHRLFFAADDGTSGREPWVSDGTLAGTFRLKDIAPGAASSIVATSVLEAEMPAGPVTAAVGTTVFFVADDGSGEELWASDGTTAGTRRVKDIRPGARGAEPRWLTAAGGRLFFTADDGTHGRELWVSDGTEAGTVLVTDLLPGAGSSLPRELLAVKSAVVFSASDGVHGIEPWASDGTWVRSLGDLAPDGLPSSPVRFTVVGDLVFFGANDGTTGFELWAFPQSALASPLDFYTVPPCRVADTRGGLPLQTNQTRSVPVTGSCGIPADAKSVAVNLTVVAPSGPGVLTAWPTGIEKPTTASLNYNPGTLRSNNAVVELGTGGQIEVHGQTVPGNGQVHLVVDVVGYFK